MAKPAPAPLENLNINLISSDQGRGSVVAIIHWLLTVGRYLIITTEVVALIIFGLSVKFTIDKNDLKEKISNQKEELDSLAIDENLFRNYQAKLKNISTLQTTHSNTSSFYTSLVSLLPGDAVLDEINLGSNKVVLSGSLPNPSALQNLISSLNSSEKFSDLDITDLTIPTAQQPYYTFTAVATLKSGVVLPGYTVPEVAKTPGGSK